MAVGLFWITEDVYNIKMWMVRVALKMYVGHMRNVLSNCTTEDARNMAILGILLLIAGIADAVRAS